MSYEMPRNSIGDIVLPKTSGAGIQVDESAPTFGFKDLIGVVQTRSTGATAPNFVSFITNIFQHQLGNATQEIYQEYHLPHDYVPGTNLYWHVHWSHNTAGTPTGHVIFTIDVTYAKGYDQAAFTSTSALTIQQAPGTQYQHIIGEIQLSKVGGGTGPVGAGTPTPVVAGTMLDTSHIEVDGLILLRLRATTNTMSGGSLPFIHFIDMHYQSTQLATKTKNVPFYS